MNICKKCNSEMADEINLVTIKTMTVRNFSKNKYYQAMGDIVTESICDQCIDKYIAQEVKPTKKLILYSLLIFLVVVISISLIILIDSIAVKIFAVIEGFIVVVALIQQLKKINKKKNIIQSNNIHKIRKMMKTELLAKLLPKKHVDADLTYIDITRIMNENLELLGKEYGVSHKKLNSIRQYLRALKKENKISKNQTQNSPI